MSNAVTLCNFNLFWGKIVNITIFKHSKTLEFVSKKYRDCETLDIFFHILSPVLTLKTPN